MAVAFVTETHPHAAAYYRFTKKEPIAPSGELTVDSVVPFHRRASVEDLLKLIEKRAKQQADILIVSHGTDDGLLLKWTAGARTELQTLPINVFLDASKSDDEKVKVLQLKKKADLTRFKGVWQKVQKLQLGRVELRSCHVGDDMATLDALRRFFGAKKVSAPDLEDAYAPLPDPESAETWKKNNLPDAVSETVAGGVVEYALERNPENTLQFRFHWKVQTKQAQAAWLNKFFLLPKAAEADGSHPSVFHGILSRDRKFLHFPKETSYRAHLKATP